MSDNDKGVIFLAAGGTGGHIFPAIALGEEMSRRGYKAILLTDKRTEKYLPKSEHISVEFIPVRYPYGSLKNKALGAISQITSYRRAKKLIKKYNTKCVIGFGGYPSFPTLYAGVSKNTGTVIHEQNSMLGKANQMLAGKVDAIATAFPDVTHIEDRDLAKVTYTGNPVRPAVQHLRELPYPVFDDNTSLHILVTGGSQGAGVFADIVPTAIRILPEEYRKRIRIDQQTRAEDIERVRNAYSGMGVNAELASFFVDLPSRMAASHLIICRSGASSLAEASVAGRPVIMVPLPNAKDNHQMVNANSYEDQEAGWVLPEASFTPEALAFRIENFFKLPSTLSDTAAKSRSAGIPDADKKLADLIETVIKNR